MRPDHDRACPNAMSLASGRSDGRADRRQHRPLPRHARLRRPDMIVRETRFAHVHLIEPTVVEDERGRLLRTFCIADLSRKRLNAAYIQHFTSCIAARGTVHGLTFVRPPRSEIRIVQCLSGRIRVVLADLRPDQRTYGEWQGLELSAGRRQQLYIPDGIAFGLQTLTNDVEVGYMNSEFHAPDAVGGIRYDDPAFGIVWPLPVKDVLPRDLRWPLFRRDAD